MKRYYLFLLILFFLSGNAISQNVYRIGETMDFIRTSKLSKGPTNNNLTESDIKGSPYLNDEFIPGSVFTTSKTKYLNIPLRFKILNDEIEFKIEENIQALAAPETIEKVEFGEYEMINTPYIVAKKQKRGFLILLEEGRASLYAKPEISFVKAKEPAAYQDAEPAKFEKKPDSYLIRIGEEAANLISNKKDLINAFPDNKDKIEVFIKNNKIKINKPETLTELVKYYNSL